MNQQFFLDYEEPLEEMEKKETKRTESLLKSINQIDNEIKIHEDVIKDLKMKKIKLLEQ